MLFVSLRPAERPSTVLPIPGESLAGECFGLMSGLLQTKMQIKNGRLKAAVSNFRRSGLRRDDQKE